jgi:predicted type IV restriction endonuclease
VIEDIQKRLRANAYQNEEHVRLSLVARVVQALGWNIWNPGEVNAEFSLHTIQGATKRSDLALVDGDMRLVFIEVKKVGELSPSSNNHITQLRSHNEDFRAPFAILTDGRYWFFFYIYSSRSFEDSRFKLLDLLEGDPDDLEESFWKFLAKDNHLNGHARTDAETEMAMTDRERRIRECVPEAKERSDRNPALSKLEALKQVFREKYHEELNDGEGLRAFDVGPPPTPRTPMVPPPRPPLSPPPPPDRDREGRCPEVARITSKELTDAVVDVIRRRGGKAHKKEIEQDAYVRFRTQFEDPWWKTTVSHGIPRWKHNGVAWKIQQAKREGLIEKSSVRGEWMLTELGKRRR